MADLKPDILPQACAAFIILFTMTISLLLRFFFVSLLSITISITNFAHAYGHHCLEDQKTLLLELKNELIFDYELIFDSSRSLKLVKWNQTDDCCSWDGVECDAAGHVISLQLDREGISGGLDGNSSSLFSLRYLKKLNLAWNDFNGTQIPRGIGTLTYLTHLKLSESGFGGHIPVELSLLRRLISLDISGNGRIQPLNEHMNLTMLLQNLTGLRELDLDDIDISIQGSEWCQVISSSLPHLKVLSLRYCGLFGPPDPSLLQLQSLSTFLLDDNNLTTVPSFFVNFSTLTVLSLCHCSLEGSFPEMIFQIPTLQELDLSHDELLNGTLPRFPLSRALRSIVITYTSLSGTLPDAFNNSIMLSHIDLSNCKFSGPIPPTLANLTELVYVDLSNNFFTGSIPPFLMSMKLAHIDLSFNSLTGALSPLHFEGLSNLSCIDLGHNSLSGYAWSQTLYLNNNKFNGTFQLEKIQRLRNLMGLDLSFNHLSVDASNINLSSSGFTQLGWLGLASCNLHSFPDLRNKSNLLFLDLSNNMIAGEIPNWIWEIGNGSLIYLNLSCNLLLDLQKPYHIPTSLWVLDLHSNLLQGDLHQLNIPSNNGNMTSFGLFFFSLANNSLNGSIPTSLCNAINYLEVIDLSFNHLNGNIPPCLLENNKHLQVFNLRSNNISGDVPDKFAFNCGLETLDLSNNNLGGKIPKSLANCESLVAMNVGNNNINDTFPCMLPSSLRLLVLRSNRFHGEVRCHKSWPNLQIIDIASNNFSGYLYPLLNFSSWRGMMQDSYAMGSMLSIYLGFAFGEKDPTYYQDEVTLIIKGLQLKLVKIWGDFAFIDLSCNNFQGSIPEAIGDLGSLHLLNLSHNALTGTIPKSIGNLTHLESVDLSANQLRGTIPMELAGLSFLQVLNLSYNKLVGEIPNGRQLQTFSADSFLGNTGLCGFNLNISCNDANENVSSPPKQENVQSHGKAEIDWDYVSAALGYVVGLGSFVWVLLCCRSLRRRCFEKVDELLERIFDCGIRKKRHGTRGRRRAVRNQVRRQ